MYFFEIELNFVLHARLYLNTPNYSTVYVLCCWQYDCLHWRRSF